MASPAPNSQHILIIGAGICGLSIAHGLAKANITSTVFEAEEASTFRLREWTMALHWSIPMLESLLPESLAERLRTHAVVDKWVDFGKYPNNAISVYDGVSGERVREIAVPEGEEVIRVSRRKLRDLVKESVDVRFGHTLAAVDHNEDSTVTANFANGTSYTGTLLIGTDGPRSTVRQHLFSPSGGLPTPLDVVYVNVSFCYGNVGQATQARSANPVSAFVVHPDCAVLISIQDGGEGPEKPETWRFQVVVTWKGVRREGLTNAERHREVKGRVKDLCEPFRSAILNIPPEVDLQFSDLGFWIPEPWDTHSGRVTLAGDAAHSMPPNRGQGLNHAINDAYNFVEAVKKIANEPVMQAEAIKSYSSEVVERGAKEVKLSRETMQATLQYEHFMDSAVIKHGLMKSPEE